MHGLALHNLEVSGLFKLAMMGVFAGCTAFLESRNFSAIADSLTCHLIHLISMRTALSALVTALVRLKFLLPVSVLTVNSAPVHAAAALWTVGSPQSCFHIPPPPIVISPLLLS